VRTWWHPQNGITQWVTLSFAKTKV